MPQQIRICIPEALKPLLAKYRKENLHDNDAQACKEIIRQFLLNHYKK
jgi:hypothetical protein